MEILLNETLVGAEGRTRTGKGLPPVDFESTASTNSATPAERRCNLASTHTFWQDASRIFAHKRDSSIIFRPTRHRNLLRIHSPGDGILAIGAQNDKASLWFFFHLVPEYFETIAAMHTAAGGAHIGMRMLKSQPACGALISFHVFPFIADPSTLSWRRRLIFATLRLNPKPSNSSLLSLKDEYTMIIDTDRLDDYDIIDLSHPWGHGAPLWPYFPDVKIERFHYHAKSQVLSQQITTFMHCTTHTDAPAHVIEGTPFMDEVPLQSYFGNAVCVDIPKKEWEVITPEDLENARPEIQPGDIVIVHTGWHRYYGDNTKYFIYSPGLYKEAGEWFVERGVKGVGVDQQALDHPLGTKIAWGPQPICPFTLDEYEERFGRPTSEDFPYWEPCHRALLGNGIVGFENVGGDIDKVVGKRFALAAFPWRWTGGDGCIVRMVAFLPKN